MGYLTRESIRLLLIWLENAKINEGPIFRRLVGRHRVGAPPRYLAFAQAVPDQPGQVRRWNSHIDPGNPMLDHQSRTNNIAS
jgi:hypothetical protein